MPDFALHVRPAAAADASRLVTMINAAFSVETFLEGPRTDPARLAAAMEKGTILMTEDENGIPMASIYTEVRGKRGYMGMLAVDPARQRSGLGRRMIKAAEAYLLEQGCVAVDITVLSLRPELLPVYRKMGFVDTGTEEFVYPHKIKDGQTCYCNVLSKWLEDRKLED